MEEKDIYQGLTKSQITKFKKEESACNGDYDIQDFSEKLLEAGANIWLRKICLEQFKKAYYAQDMRLWISKLIAINEIEAANQFLEEAKKKAKKKGFVHRDYKELAEVSCLNIDLKKKYAKNFYDKAVEDAGDDIGDLSYLIMSVANKKYLNSKEYTNDILKIALEKCNCLGNINSLNSLLNGVLIKADVYLQQNYSSFIDVLKSKGKQFCNRLKNIHGGAYKNSEETTVSELLAYINTISDVNEVKKLLDFAVKITNEVDLLDFADYYQEQGDVDSALAVLDLAIDKSQKRYATKAYNGLNELNLNEIHFFDKLDSYGNQSEKVKTKLLNYLDILTPKIKIPENLLKDYNLKNGRFLYIILAYKPKAKKYNYSISLDMEKRVVLGRRFDYHYKMGHWPNNDYIRWHDNEECPTRVRNAMDNTTQNFTGLITIKCSDNFENFIKNDDDYHELESSKTYGGAEDFTPRYPNSKFIWEVNCKNGKIKNPSPSFSDYCKEEEILNTVGNGKNVFELNQFIFTKYGQTFDELKVEFPEKTQDGKNDVNDLENHSVEENVEIIKNLLRSEDFEIKKNGLELVKKLNKSDVYDQLLSVCGVDEEGKLINEDYDIPEYCICEIVNISEVSKAKEIKEKLNYLEIDYFNKKQIENLDFLSNLTNITELSLQSCKNLTNIDGLANLTNIKSLDLYGCSSLKNIDSLAKLKNLTNLNLGSCSSLENINSLSELEKLTELNLDWCSNLTNIDCLANIEDLNVSFSQMFFEDWDSLAKLTKIKLKLNFNNSYLDNVDFLSNLTNITELSFNSCKNLTNVDGLAKLTQLTDLNLYSCSSLKNLDGLANLTELRTLEIGGCSSLTNKDGIANLTNLKVTD
jgi:internalin A